MADVFNEPYGHSWAGWSSFVRAIGADGSGGLLRRDGEGADVVHRAAQWAAARTAVRSPAG